MASPYIIDENVIKYIDYDLDLRVFPDGGYKILDYNDEKGVLIEDVDTKKEYYININDIKSSNLVFK